MDFERRYPHPKLQYEYFVVRWSKGYRSAELWYNNRLVVTVTETEQLLKGVKFHDDMLGDVEFKLEEDPYVLNVKVDGFHSKFNSKHPEKGIRSVSNWVLPGILYYLLAIIVTVSVLFDSRYGSMMSKFPLYYNLVGLGLLVAIYFLIRFVSPVFLFAGVFIYLLQLLYFSLNVFQSPSVHVFWIILYLGYLTFVIAMFLPTRRVISYMRHKKYDFNTDSEVLDN